YEALHAYDYMMYGFMQLAKDRDAKNLVEEVLATKKLNVDHFVGAYAMASIPARYSLERRQWAEAGRLTLTPPDLGWDKFPQAESITWFARGIGAARSGDAAEATKSLERIDTLRAALTLAKNNYWAEQSEIQRLAVAGWIARAQNRNEEAVNLLRQAADREAATEKHPVTPGALFPSRDAWRPPAGSGTRVRGTGRVRALEQVGAQPVPRALRRCACRAAGGRSGQGARVLHAAADADSDGGRRTAGDQAGPGVPGTVVTHTPGIAMRPSIAILGEYNPRVRAARG